jgi:DNA-binding MarR family transcriptional regulator
VRHSSIEPTPALGLQQGQRPAAGVEELLAQLHELSTKLASVLRPSELQGTNLPCSLQLVEDVLRFRKQRNRTFGGALFGEPAWDILLELYTVGRTGRQLSVSGACYSSGVPVSTALRWISRLEKEGWIVRIDDPSDARRSWLKLSNDADQKMDDFFSRMAA